MKSFLYVPEYRYGIQIDEFAVTALDKVARDAEGTNVGIKASMHLMNMAKNDPYRKDGFFSQNLPRILRENVLNKYR